MQRDSLPTTTASTSTSTTRLAATTRALRRWHSTAPGFGGVAVVPIEMTKHAVLTRMRRHKDEAERKRANVRETRVG